MYELYSLFACFIVPVALVIAGAVWYARQSRAAPRPPDVLPAMRQRIETWVSQGRLSAGEAAPVLRVIAEELLRHATVAPAVARPATVIAPAAASPAPVAPVQPQPAPAPAKPPRPSRAERLWAGVLALRTRQMLLFLGAFLLVVSSLVLVVFNWENFPAVLQCGLLAAVCGALWGAGEWLDRRWKMASAGAGLRAVAGVLAPIVGGAITRLLSIAPHPALLLVSLVCLGLYLVAARRTGQRLFSVVAGLAGASVVLAVCGFVSWPALPAALCFALIGYLPLARWLRGSALAIGPQATAHVLVPATLFISAALAQSEVISGVALGAALAAGALFYATAALLDRKAVWSWAASALGPFAVVVIASELQPGRPALWALALVTTMACYLAVARLLRTRNLGALAVAPNAVAHVVVPVALFGAALWSFGTAEGSLALWAGLIFYALAIIFTPVPRWSVLAAFVLPVALVSTCFAGELTARTTIEGMLLAVATAYLLLARWLRGGRHATLAFGPLAIAHAIVPLVVANVLLTRSPVWPEALLLWGATGFYLLALALGRRAAWLWPALLLAPVALVTTCLVVNANATAIWAILSMLVLGYVVLGVAVDTGARWFALPGFVVGALLGVVVAAGAVFSGVAALQWSLPALVAACGLFVAATHRARLQWLGAQQVEWLSSVVLGVGTLLLAAWLWYALDRVLPQAAWRAVVLLPFVAVVFAGARFWPGKLRGGYPLSLRIAATALAFAFGAWSLGDRDAGVAGIALLTLVWTTQLFFQRNTFWATLALGTAVFAAGFGLDRFNANENVWLLTAFGFAAVYTLGAARARNSAWRCLVVPGTAIGILVGFVLLLLAILGGLSPAAKPIHVVVTIGLAALAAAHSAIWRRWWLGYLAGPLLAIGVVLAASRGFFVIEPPRGEDYAYVLSGFTIGMLALGEALRRRARAFAAPYEQLGFFTLVGALALAGFEPQHATLAWLAAALACGYTTFRHRIAWAIVPALLAGDTALLFGMAWLAPGGELSGAGLLLVAATWAQALLALAARRFWPALRPFAYLGAAASGAAGLCFAASGAVFGGAFYAPTMQAALALAALLALLATVERREEAAWGALGLLALGVACWHVQLGIPMAWSAAYGVAEALGLCLIGWMLERFANRPSLRVWQRPLREGMLGAGSALAAVAVPASLLSNALQPLIFALVMLALLLATLAVRQRRIALGYAAGGALVAAALAQLFQAGVREPQGYALPSGLYLVALADGLRRFQGRRQVARLLESGALGLILGTAATQAIQTDGPRGFTLTLLLCAISFVLLGYGMVRRLQVPFAGGAAGFVFGVLWLAVDPLRATNSWVMLGLLGLGLVGLYVLLERRQEQLVRAGRVLIERFSAWG